MKLSIIVPVYNVEKYIRLCFDSILNQNLNDDDYEIIVVNDGSTDNSINEIDDIIRSHRNIFLINQNNQGLSMARNNGLSHATGEYVLFIDSDDLFINNTLPTIITQAYNNKVDLLVADFYKMEDSEINNIPKEAQLTNIDSPQIMNGFDLMQKYLIPDQCYVWRTIYRRDFLIDNKIRFIRGICFEDIPFTHECYLKAKKCIRLQIPFYIYRKGHSSISSALNKKKGMDYCIAIKETWELTFLEGLSPEIIQRLKDDVFVSFSALIYGITHDITNNTERNLIVNYMKQIAPNMYFSNGLKQIFVNFMYQRIPYLYIYVRAIYGRYFEKAIRRWRTHNSQFVINIISI